VAERPEEDTRACGGERDRATRSTTTRASRAPATETEVRDATGLRGAALGRALYLNTNELKRMESTTVTRPCNTGSRPVPAYRVVDTGQHPADPGEEAG
jgi:hypothetical protein